MADIIKKSKNICVFLLIVCLLFLFSGCTTDTKYADIEMPNGKLITIQVEWYSLSGTQTKIKDTNGKIYIIDNSKVMIYTKGSE